MAGYMCGWLSVVPGCIFLDGCRRQDVCAFGWLLCLVINAWQVYLEWLLCLAIGVRVCVVAGCDLVGCCVWLVSDWPTWPLLGMVLLAAVI